MRKLIRVIRLSAPIVLVSLILLGKDGVARYVFFGPSCLHGLLTASLPTILAVLSWIELAGRRNKLWMYVAANVVLTTVYFLAILYHQYFGVVVTYQALQQLGQVTKINSSVANLMRPYILLIYLDIAVFLLLFALRKSFRMRCRAAAGRMLDKRAAAAVLAVSLIISITRIYADRGIVNERKQAESMGILNYEAFAIWKDLHPPGDMNPDDVIPENIRVLKGVNRPAKTPYQGIAAGKPVIVVQLESFQNFLIGLSVGGQEVTPNMNKLRQESVYFPYFYQMVGQGNTSDAEFILNTSLYVPERGAASQLFAGRRLPGLPRLFREHGYETLTFHTNGADFWNRKRLYRALGFERYYDETFFGREDMVAFGASDEVLYRKTAQKLAERLSSGRAFYANVISMSSHHPFRLPADKRALKLPERFKGTLTGDYMQAVHYADMAFGSFVEELKRTGLWEKCLIVVYGDHAGLTLNALTARDRTLLEQELGRPYGYPDMLCVPLFIAAPGMIAGELRDRIGGQIDLYPTIAGLAGLNTEREIIFGQDLFNAAPNLLPERYYLPNGSYLNDSVLFIPGKGADDGAFYRLREEKEGAVTLQGRPASSASDFERAQRLLKWSDNYTRSLPLEEP